MALLNSKKSQPGRDHDRRADEHAHHRRRPREPRPPRKAHLGPRHAHAPGLDRGPDRRGHLDLRPQPGHPVGGEGHRRPVLRQPDEPPVPQQGPGRRGADPPGRGHQRHRRTARRLRRQPPRPGLQHRHGFFLRQRPGHLPARPGPLGPRDRPAKGRIISSPKVSTQNNKQAEIIQGRQIPVQTVANFTVTTRYINAALELRATPQITAEGTIIMGIEHPE